MMDVALALQIVELHYLFAMSRFRDAQDPNCSLRHLASATNDLVYSLRGLVPPASRQTSGRLALQVAGLALCILDDLDLELVGPHYDAVRTLPAEPV